MDKKKKTERLSLFSHLSRVVECQVAKRINIFGDSDQQPLVACSIHSLIKQNTNQYESTSDRMLVVSLYKHSK